jgi:hypothetical protein
MPVHRTPAREPRFLRFPHASISLLPARTPRPTPRPLTGEDLVADLAQVEVHCQRLYRRSCRSIGLDARVLGRMISACPLKERFTAGRLAHALSPLFAPGGRR